MSLDFRTPLFDWMARMRDRRRSQARLNALPDTMLKDLGISRSEISSVARQDRSRRRSRAPEV